MNTSNFKSGRDSGFTLSDLLVIIGTCGMLALLVLPALGNAKDSSRQLSCLNNLRQLGIATRMYVVDNQAYTGGLYSRDRLYVWPDRLLSYTGGQRSVFSCPAAVPSSRWDTNLNNTIRARLGPDLKPNFMAITTSTRFSYGINDWGLSIYASPQLGLGGDIDAGKYIRDSDVVAPSQMIMLGDTPAQSSGSILYAASLDPTSGYGCQLPSNRHQYQTDLVFADGHVETPLRNDVINPTNDFWRSRWNNDNQPHNEFTWTVSTNIDLLDPSY